MGVCRGSVKWVYIGQCDVCVCRGRVMWVCVGE